MAWQTTPPPIGVPIEFETDRGKMLTGKVSFVASENLGGGRWTTQYMLRRGEAGVFHIMRWRRVS